MTCEHSARQVNAAAAGTNQIQSSGARTRRIGPDCSRILRDGDDNAGAGATQSLLTVILRRFIASRGIVAEI
jgi:hypothetical protein